MNLEKALIDTTDNNINMTVPWYLMACYAYYEEDDPIIEDGMFDRLTRRMINHWDDIEHLHKDFLSLDMLKASTYVGEYPSRVKNALEELRNTYKN